MLIYLKKYSFGDAVGLKFIEHVDEEKVYPFYFDGVFDENRDDILIMIYQDIDRPPLGAQRRCRQLQEVVQKV